MTKSTISASVSAVALMLAVPAFAQDALVGVEALDDQIDTITSDVEDDLARGNDAQRFGNNGVPQGWRGSVALQTSATSGNTNNRDVSGAGRLTYGIGDWSHELGFAVEFGRSEGVTDEEKFYATYEANRYFTPEFYAFGIGRFEFDNFETNERDAFLGFGPGYRLVNNEDMTWRVQAGPGIRYTRTQAGVSSTEVGYIASSRFYMSLTDTMSLTNDTDILGSSQDHVITNDLGVNFRMTDNLSTRVSYRTEYNSAPAAGLASTDNTLGLSLVVGF